MAIHVARDDAVHVQSRVVVTAILLDVPAAGAVPAIALAAETSHFTADGAVTSIDDEAPPHADTSNSSAHALNSRARIAVGHSAIALPAVETMRICGELCEMAENTGSAV